MKRTIPVATTLLALLPDVAKSQWTFDIVSVEAYINDHRKQRSPLLTRNTLEYSNQLLHEYSHEETGRCKEANTDLDRYTRVFDVIDATYQFLRTVLNVKDTYSSVSDRIDDYETMLEAFHKEILRHGNIEPSDALILTINEEAIRGIASEGEHLHKSASDLVLYATGAAACSTSNLLMVLESMNKSLDSVERYLDQAYVEAWGYIRVRIDYWKSKIYRERTKREIIDGAFGRWRDAEQLDY